MAYTLSSILALFLLSAQIHDPINPSLVIPVKKWKLRVVDVQSSLPPPVLVSRILNEVVNKSTPHVDISQQVSPERQTTGLFELHKSLNCDLFVT